VRGGAFALALWLAAAPALAGTEITIETRKASRPDAKPQRSIVEVEGRRLRAEAGNGRRGALWSGEEGVLQVLDHREQSVFRIDRATARQMLGARDGVREQLEALPPAQRETLERWIGGAPPAPVELRRTGGSAQVGGVGCRLVEALRGGARLAEVCEGPRAALGVTPEALAPARELAAFLAEVGSLLPRSLAGEGLDALALVPQLKGVPLRVRVWPPDAAASESRIVGAVPKRIAPERFQAPAGYRSGWNVQVGGAAAPGP
jgi:hypothetical protein